jgi:Protein of unknown function DUF262/Protein of unknown function (DUF1524)
MSRSLNTDTEDLKEILSNGKSYVVPAFQRNYAWKEENWEDLWEDLLVIEQNESAADGERDHYMGALVLELVGGKQFRVIDGQQRLATLSIFILAVINYLRTISATDPQNSERADLITSQYIGAKDPATLRIVPKLRLNDSDNPFFQNHLVQARPPASPRTLTDSERLLWACYEFFQKKVKEKFNNQVNGEAIAQFVGSVVTERLIFISVRVQDQLSAYTVFETLNARGVELTETDLLKNYLLSVTNKEAPSQLSELVGRWNRVTERVGSSKFPEFLRHHVNSSSAFVRQKALFKHIKQNIDSVAKAYSLLDALETDAAWYAALQDEESEFWFDYEGAREHVHVLTLFDVSQYIPLVLAAKDVLPPDRIVDVMKYCAVISIRFNGVSKQSTHPLETTYNTAALGVRRTKKVHDVKAALSAIYISDEDFEDAFARLTLSSRGKSAKRLRYFLGTLERHAGKQDLADDSMRATIEHILPQNPGSSWPEISQEIHKRIVDRVGNYTLLEKRLNAGIANDRFEEKQKVYKQSIYQMTRDLTDPTEWNEEELNRRQRKMAEIAKTIWRY